ncbi:HEAT repeat domain-containing protein [Candidatus Poribacteria bacterium]|nr:HEAT repeat domain-containing protein [Candidatus Poribacteria bacterium]
MTQIRTLGRFPTLGEMKAYYARDDVLSFLYDECQMRNIEIAFRRERWPINPKSKTDLRAIIEKEIEKIERAYRGASDPIDSIRLNKCDYLSFHFRTSITSGEKLIGFDTIFESDVPGWRPAFEDLSGVIRLLDNFEVCYRIKYSGVRSLHLMLPFEALPLQFNGKSILSQRTEIQRRIGDYFRRHCGMKAARGGGVLRLAYSLNEDNGLVSIPISSVKLSSFRPWEANIYNITVDKPWHGEIPPDASRKALKFLQKVYNTAKKTKKKEKREVSFGLEILPKVRSGCAVKSEKSSISTWVAQLKSDEEAARVSAAWHLMMMPEAVPLSIIQQGLLDENSDVRWYLTEALQKSLSDDVLFLAAKMLWDDDQLVWISAVDTLVLSNEDALKTVLDSIQTPLNSTHRDNFHFLRTNFIYAIQKICTGGDLEVIQLLVRKLSHDISLGTAIPQFYVSVLEDIRKKGAVPLITIREIANSLEIDFVKIPSCRLTEAERKVLQSAVKGALTDISIKQKARILVLFMLHGGLRLMEPSAKVLLKIGIKEAVKAIEQAQVSVLKTTRHHRPVMAVNLLRQIKPLIEKCPAANKALDRIAGRAAVPGLIRVFKEVKDSEVCMSISLALVAIGDRGVPALFEALRDENMRTRRAVARALGRIGNLAAVPALIKVLRDKHAPVRTSAAEALGAIGDPAAVPALIEALRDKSRYVRREAVEALRNIGTPEAIEAVEKSGKWFT